MKTARIRKNPHEEVFQVTVPWFWDLDKVTAFIRRNSDWIEQMKLKSGLHRQKYGDAPTREDTLRLLGHVKERFPLWEERMRVRASKVTVKLMDSRWGSCNVRTRAISISARLYSHPLSHLDYVIVHELAHITYPDHSDAFWDRVEKFIPDWRAIRDEMR